MKKEIFPGLFAGRINGLIEWYGKFIKTIGIDPTVNDDILSSELLKENYPNFTYKDTNYKFADTVVANSIVDAIRKGIDIDFELYFALVNFYQEKFDEFDSICGL